jgi:hypothetical protein
VCRTLESCFSTSIKRSGMKYSFAVLLGGCARDLGVLLSLSCVLAAPRVVVLSVMICGSTMRFGCALVVLGCFCA